MVWDYFSKLFNLPTVQVLYYERYVIKIIINSIHVLKLTYYSWTSLIQRHSRVHLENGAWEGLVNAENNLGGEGGKMEGFIHVKRNQL